MNLASARLFLVHKRPYLAAALYALKPVEVPGLGTMAVDKWWRLYYDPDLGWNPTEVASVLYHEINHLLRDHSSRGETLDSKVWNIAGDMEINDDIVEEGQWALPAGVVTPGTFGQRDGQLAETYYEWLMKQPGQGRGQGGQGQGNSSSGNSPGGSGEQQPGSGPGNGNCGSAADGQSKEYEEPSSGDANREVSKTEAEMIQRKVAQDIKSTGIGTVPAEWQRWADAILEPKIDWKKELRAQIYRAVEQVVGQVDYTYRRPSRRQSVMGKIVFPSMQQPVVQISVVVDTSGSMSDGQVTQAVAEIGGIIRALGMATGINVLSCDASVHTVQKVFNARQVTPMGGGGTDMGIGIRKAEDLKPKPNIIVVLTDAYTPWPKNPPKCNKVIVGVIGGTGEGIPPWARAIMIDAESEG